MRTRTARVESIGDDGSFNMVLATEGEASDGDILSIKGGQVPERMPLLLSHWNDPTATAGSVTDPSKHLKESPPELRAVGQIEMGGEGALAEVRRDVAYMIGQGHVGAVSIRWDEVEGGKPPIRRINLPSDHPAFVPEDEKSPRKRYGMFWPEWRALEGSIVALGADPKALIGRSQETEGVVASFWRAMADEAGKANLAAVLSCLRVEAGKCKQSGATTADLINAVVDDATEPIEPVEIDERMFFLPQGAADQLARERQERERAPDPEPETVEALDPEPPPEETPDPVSPLAFDLTQIRVPVDAEALGAAMVKAMDEYEARLKRNVQGIFDLFTGKVR